MVAQRLERMVDRVRQWRSGSSTSKLNTPVVVAADLPEADLPRLRQIIDDCLLARGGELAARQRATAIAATFLGLDEEGRRSFFRLLADEYDHDDEAVDQCMAMVAASQDLNERRIAELALAEALRPKRQRLLHRFVGLEGGLGFLVDHEADRAEGASVDTAIFYSISNCHRGLAGVSLGDFLIKKVVEDLVLELPNIKTFATLSPIPGFRRWLTDQLQMQVEIVSPEQDSFLTPVESALISPGDPPSAAAVLLELISSDTTPPRVSLDPLQSVLTRLVATYLSGTRFIAGKPSSEHGARAIDPVAHFHLSNGARIEHVNWWANPNQTGWERSLAFMVNYRYVPGEIESNHDGYVGGGKVPMADELHKLLTVP